MGFLINKGVYLKDFLDITKIEVDSIYVIGFKSPYVKWIGVKELIDHSEDTSKVKIYNMNVTSSLEVYLEIDY